MICWGMPYLLEMHSIEECASLCQELGLSFVELNANFPDCQLHRLKNCDLSLLKEKYDICFTLHLEEECDPFSFNPEVRRAWLETVRKSLEYAVQQQMPIVNMHLPHGVYITLPDRKTYLYEQYEQEYHQALSDFRELCEEKLTNTGTRLAIENTDGWKQHELRAIEYLLRSPVIGLTLDIGHSHGVNDVDEPFFRHYEECLIHMHGHDALGRKNHLALGAGEINLAARFAWAASRGARIVLETKTIAALRTSVSRLPEILAKNAKNLSKPLAISE